MLPHLRKFLVESSIAVAAIAALYGVWMTSRAVFGFEDKSAGQVIAELKAEDIRDRSRDSTMINDLFGVKSLAEANTIMLCSLVDSSIKNQILPCKRLLRERGIE